MAELDFLVIVQLCTQQFVQLVQIFRTAELPLIAKDTLKLLAVDQAMQERFEVAVVRPFFKFDPFSAISIKVFQLLF